MKRCHEWLFKGKNIQNEKSDDNKTEDSVNKNEDINDVNADLNMTSEIEDITKVKTINKNNESNEEPDKYAKYVNKDAIEDMDVEK